MSSRFFASIVVLAVVIGLVSLTSEPVGGQAPAASASKPAAWASRTPDGQPDLQGFWTNATITSFERPPAVAGREFFTEEEAATIEAHHAQGFLEPEEAAKVNPVVGGGGGKIPGSEQFNTRVVAWYTDADLGPLLPTRRTSLVVDPPDGIVPIRPEAEAQRDYYKTHQADSFEYLTPWDRCITRGVPGAMLPTTYNNNYQILQAPGYVVIRYEMIHDARIIPLDGRPHVGPNIRQWMGDSRGRWEGDTLVVETTNFNGRSTIGTHGAAGRLKGVLQSAAGRVVERFKRIDANTISYQVTLDDPKVYTRPWTIDLPLTKTDAKIFEYACHEGNMPQMENLFWGAAAEAKEKASRER